MRSKSRCSRTRFVIHTDPQSLTRARLLGRLAIAKYWSDDSELGLCVDRRSDRHRSQ